EFNLVPDLTVYENIFLGREDTTMGFVHAVEEQQKALHLFQKIGIKINPEAHCRDLSVAQQQIVEIARALSVNAKIIVMDEPSAALTIQEVDRLFKIVRDLKKHDIGIIYTSHRLEEIFQIADRVMVLRDGEHIGTVETSNIGPDKLIEMMVGRPINAEFPPRKAKLGRERLRVENLARAKAVQGVSFSVRAGEVLGFAGLIGAGRTETMRLIFGADLRDSGRIFVNNREVNIRNPKDAIKSRICLLTEDRKGQGLVLIHSCRENFGLPNLDQFSRGIFVDQRQERRQFSQFVDSLKIKIASTEQIAINLSGGNQQKLVLAKWLARNTDIIIFDEPTRGIDVATKYEIYLLINELAAKGKAIILISSELPEILGLSDRVIVMHGGKITGEITDVAQATQQDILSLAIA
ncbi:MAG: ATP-binding cassette domain-containing protein, partial [Gammaproteobacteria bacterium]|nr:ATP-binding cassette domain-containing protein [Gammaproteobacteria bacterium]